MLAHAFLRPKKYKMTEQEMSGAVGFISEVVFYLLCLDCGIGWQLGLLIT